MKIQILKNTLNEPIKFFLHDFLPFYKSNISTLLVPCHFSYITFYYKQTILHINIEFNKVFSIYKNNVEISTTKLTSNEELILIFRNVSNKCEKKNLDKICEIIFENYLFTNIKFEKLCTLKKIENHKTYLLNFYKLLKDFTKLNLNTKNNLFSYMINENTNFYKIYLYLDIIMLYANSYIKSIILCFLDIEEIPVLTKHKFDVNLLKQIYRSIVSKNYKDSLHNMKLFNLINDSKYKIINIFNSKSQPIKFKYEESYYIFKYNVNLSNDLFFVLLTKYICKILDMEYKSFKIHNDGIIEYLDSVPIYNIKIFSSNNFIESFTMSLLINYLFKIGDRTMDNMLIDKQGYCYNIDFEYILGDDPKIFIPLVIPNLVSNYFIKHQLYDKFKLLFYKYFTTVKENFAKILLYSKIIYNLNSCKFEFDKFEKTFINNLNKNKYEEISSLIDGAICDYKTHVCHFINKISKYKTEKNLFKR